MCGITGKISFIDKPVSRSEIEAMNGAIVHRGPDDGGTYVSPDGKVGLGHRRLSIIDLSPLGHQPMRYLDRYEIVFNGEIYNFQEKREMLEKDGYTFASHSDTEVILALYDKYGKDCLQHLRGMFAFAIYDKREQTLFCARDRVGKKPFKYYVDDNVFLFASELKAILTQSEYHREPDSLALHHYLTLRYVPAPLTGFVGIKKLEPAHFLLVDLKTGKIEKERYWKLDYSEKLDLSEGEWKQKIMEKLEEAVKIRMVSDVPIGAFLSGGIDSSAVVGLMSRHSTAPVKTFSIGFNEEKYNELPYAKTVSELFKTEHTEFIVEPKAMEVMPLLVRHFEEPFADKSMIPTYYVSKLTRERVTVALSGDGGDENFAGYAQHGIFRFSLIYDRVRFLHTLIVLPVVRFLAEHIETTFFLRAYQFAKTMAEPPAHRYANYMCYFTDEEKRDVYTDDFRRRFADVDSLGIIAETFSDSGSEDRLDQALFADFTTYLPDDLMVKADITTMAASLESRSPFLDHEFLELTAKIPSRLKIRGINNRKYILKKALEGFLPDGILYRKKMGFASPIDVWFKTDLRDYARELLLSEKALARGIFRKEAIEKMLDDHVTTDINYARHILALVVLESWFLEFFDEKTV
jgi:asparagine synthase (glutamine-hydrolysing)